MKALIFCVLTLLACSNAEAASEPSNPVVVAFHEGTMMRLAELSEAMFAGEGEGSTLSEKILSADDVRFVIDRRQAANKMLNFKPGDPLLVEIVLFADKILTTNAELVKSLSAGGERAPMTAIFSRLADLSKYYGDIPSTVDCRSPKRESEKIVCRDPYFTLLELLSTRAQAYAIENATKAELNHRKFKPKFPISCTDSDCLYQAFRKSLAGDLGGTSPLGSDG